VARVARTVIVKSVRLPRRLFRVFVELEAMYRNMVEQLTMYAVRNDVKSFTRLKAMKYREMRKLYQHLTLRLHSLPRRLHKNQKLLTVEEARVS